ncbi:MAG: LLM class flavin-dependent oxidoreductase [Deltaproteobacteria bacterium]|nr:LLM class flavin-dependent oxidoreductase [Deltaproteobacteria bacterium]
MTRLQFGTGTTVRRFDDYRRWLEIAEATGFDLLTCGDSQSLWAECFSLMTFAAMTTRRAKLAITVSNPATRHPAVIASACAGIQQLAGGRFRYGLSSGDSALRNIGVEPASVAQIERTLRAVQTMTAGGTYDDAGHALALHWLPEPAPVPVWLAAEGPKTQRLAGRVADGVILSNCLTPDRLAVAMDHIAAGAAEAGRSLDAIEIWHMCNLIFAPSEREGIDSIRSVLAGTANHVFRFTLAGKGLPAELESRIRGLMSEYQSRFHAHPGAANPNEGLIDKYGLRDYLARQGTIAGPPERCVERLHEVASYGVRNLIVSQFIQDQPTWMQTFGERVLPHFR